MLLFNALHLCLETIYSNESHLLGSGGVLIKKLLSQAGGGSFERGALSREGAHSNKYGRFDSLFYFLFRTQIPPSLMLSV